MAEKFGKIFTSRDKLTHEALNAAFLPIYAEIEALRATRADYEAQITLFNSEGIKRVSEAVKPLVDQIGAAIDGGLLVAQTDDLVAIVAGAEIDFLIPEASRVAFRPTPFLAITAPDVRDDWAIGRVLVYNDTTGLLKLEILYLNGSGAERTGWTISASAGVVEAVSEWFTQITALRDQVVADAATVAADKATVAADKATVLGYKNAASQSVIDAAAEVSLATDQAGIATIQAGIATTKAAEAAASAASIAGGPVASINSMTGIVTGIMDLANAQDITGLKTVKRGAAEDIADWFRLQPTDYGSGKPLLRISKLLASSTTWDIGLFDGTNNAGTLNFDVANLTHGGAKIMTNADISEFDKIKRVALTGARNTVVSDFGKLLDSSGTFTVTFDPAASLGDGWWCFIRNSGAGDVTLDPNGTETIDGLTSFIMYPNEVRLIQSDGMGLRSIVINAFSKTFTASGNFIKPPGYSAFYLKLWGGGGSGGCGSSGTAGGGGGGGAHVDRKLPSSLLATTEVVTIAAGGAAVTGANNGLAGGNTTFGSLATAFGGAGGLNNGNGGGGGGTQSAGANTQGGNPQIYVSSAGGSQVYGGGTGWSTTPFKEDSAWGGGSGGKTNGGNSVFGGAGGGGSGTGGASIEGGNGGNGGGSGAGGSGSAPAGGGGSTSNNAQLSGAGARGEARIEGAI